MASNNIFVGGRGLFTSSDPMSALRAQPPPTWSAVMPQYLTPQVAAAYKQAGIALVIWEPQASQAGADAVKQYGAAGYIAQAEGQSQLDAANQVGSQITVPKALVSNNFMSAYPPGWVAMPEAYQNNNPNQTVENVTADAHNLGAQIVVPVIGVGFADNGGKIGQTGDYNLNVPGVSGSAMYIADQASDADLAAYTGSGTPSQGPGKAQPPEGGQQQPRSNPPPPAPAPPAPPGPQPPPPPAHGTTHPLDPNPPNPNLHPFGAQAPDTEDIPDPGYARSGWQTPPVAYQPNLHPPGVPFTPQQPYAPGLHPPGLPYATQVPNTPGLQPPPTGEVPNTPGLQPPAGEVAASPGLRLPPGYFTGLFGPSAAPSSAPPSTFTPPPPTQPAAPPAASPLPYVASALSQYHQQLGLPYLSGIPGFLGFTGYR